MLSRTNRGGTTILRPSVLAALVYFGLCAIGFLWILLTLQHPRSDSMEPFRLVTPMQFLGLTAANAALAVAFVVDGWFARTSPPGLRRAHFAGLGLGAVTLAVLQYGAVCARGPIPPARQAAPDDEVILTELLATLARGADGILTVPPRTTWWPSLDEDPARSKGFVFERLAQASPRVAAEAETIQRLLDELWTRNRVMVALSLPSDLDAGYEVDHGWRMAPYFALEGGGWERWYEDNPGSAGSAAVSLPVHDPESGWVLVYWSRTSGGLAGGGEVSLYRYDDQRLEKIARATIWVA